MNTPAHLTVSHRRQSRKATVHATEHLRERLSPVDRAALWVTHRVGTMGFFGCIVAWVIVWLSWNRFGPPGMRFDPLPGCVLQLLISNEIQLCLMPLIMVGQAVESRRSESMAEAHYHSSDTVLAELDAIHEHLELQTNLLARIAMAHGIPTEE